MEQFLDRHKDNNDPEIDNEWSYVYLLKKLNSKFKTLQTKHIHTIKTLGQHDFTD